MVQSPGLKYILANSRETAGEFQEWYGFPASRIKVVYNGLDRSRFHPGLVKHREAVRRELGLAPDEPVTLFVGSGFQRKGLGELAEALGRIPGRLLVIGRDDPRPVRRRAAKAGGLDKLIFLGGRTDVERFYGAADVFALPSWYEPFSNACLEAAASGLPVVTTRGSGAAEIIRPGENGCLVDFPVDVHELADRVNHAFSLDRDRVQQVNQPLLAPFSWEKNLSETLAVYNQILGGDWKA
jgi:UDP-glucose:(heptosyl)LPS alpha-1,3-glucosyltransferase